MRRWIIHCRFLCAALCAPALAWPMTIPAQAQADSETAALDALFAQLKSAADAAAARVITDRIWLLWTTPSDPMLASQMRDVLLLREQADFPAVLALLDTMTRDHPDYAEGWNQRATINFLLGRYEASLGDIEKVLQFEPRHFGALVGRAMIYRAMGKEAEALVDMRAALAIHPFLTERALFPELDDILSI